MADATSNIPKHGDEIITQQRGVLGSNKLVATKQFQRFLDELGDLFNQLGTGGIDDIEQQVTSIESALSNTTSALRQLTKGLIDSRQESNIDSALISQLRSENRRLKRKVDDLEQLIHVN